MGPLCLLTPVRSVRMARDDQNYNVRIYPDPVLRKVAKPVREFDERLATLIDSMIDIMYDSEGIGLAAPQIGVQLRVFVCDVPPSDDRSVDVDPPTATDGPVAYINPKITFDPGGVVPGEEGCLSLPDIRGDVVRPPVVTIRAFHPDGTEFTQRGAGLLARCWQHELDHLDGVLIIDKMTQASRLKTKAAVRNLERAAEED